jgi:hypothetical protein
MKINMAKLIEQLSRFIFFAQQMDGQPECVSFRDSNGLLCREEDYKTSAAEEARKELKINSWNENWIGTGKISECARKAINKSHNLVYVNNKIHFENRLAECCIEAERALYDIYRNPLCDDATAFANAVRVFGAKYDIIAFLFFVKDTSQFLPISPRHFDEGFAVLGINYKTSRRCGWKNYKGFVDIIKEIRDVMKNMLPMYEIPRLIDAHSFVWIIQQDRFINWNPDAKQSVQIEQMTEEYIQGEVSGNGGRRSVVTSTFIRSAEVVEKTRKRANGICQYCNQRAPFDDKDGNPYLEVHHIIWLSRGGEDSTSNTVALCPNCHKLMHILDKPEDVEKLQGIINSAKAI